MCRTKKIAPRSDHRIIKEKKKTCSEKCGPKACLNWIRRFLIKKYIRYVKKKVFGDPDPKLHEYEVFGVNLGSIKDNILSSKDHSLEKKVFGVSDLKLHEYELVGVNLGSIKDKILPSKDHSLKNKVFGDSNLKLHKLVSVNKGSINDKILPSKDHSLKNKVFGDSNLKLHELVSVNKGSIKDKMLPSKNRSLMSLVNQNRKMTKLYLKDLDLIKGMNANELEKKFSVSPSKAKVLDKLFEDYNKGRLSISKMPDKPRLKAKKLNKENLNKIIENYDTLKNRSKSRSSKIIEKLREMDPTELKKKFSLTSSKHRVLEHMVDDYRKNKVSFSKLLLNKSKFSTRGMSKGQVNEMLQDYEAQKKNIKVPFSLPSSFVPIIDEIKNARISISSVTRKVFKK